MGYWESPEISTMPPFPVPVTNNTRELVASLVSRLEITLLVIIVWLACSYVRTTTLHGVEIFLFRKLILIRSS